MDPQLTHAFEQLGAATQEMAVMLVLYHAKLIEEGLDKDVATELTIALQRTLVRGDDG